MPRAPEAGLRVPAMNRACTPAALLAGLAGLAVGVPSLLAWNVPPSTTFLNQALAVALWGAFVGVGTGQATPGAAARACAPAGLALALIAAAAAYSTLAGGLPASLAGSALALLAAAAVVLLAGATAPRAAFPALCIGLTLAALPNVGIALVQVFAPQWADGDVIARSSISGRAVGNLRQPNHLSTLLLCAAIAVVALVEMRRLRRSLALLALAAVMGAVVLTASRTGMVGAALLGVWALADRRLTRTGRALLLWAPACFAAAWAGMLFWSSLAQQTFGGQARLGESVESSSRVAIWRDTLVLIGEHPWTGVGFGKFNFAWSLTPLPQRPVAFFDHTHNLPLHLAVELGVPLAAAVLGLLAWALARAVARAWAPFAAAAGPSAADDAGVSRRFALAVVAMIGLHSLLEYPLWYAYFLLPAAWCLGWALAPPRAQESAGAVASPLAGLRLAGALMVLGAAGAVADFARVVPIFEPASDGPTLEERIARGQRSVLFAHHAHYAAGTVSATPAAQHESLQRAAHHLLDTRLMMAWARAFADSGDLDRARHLAARLREFGNPAAAEFFEPCAAQPVLAHGAREAQAVPGGPPVAPGSASPQQAARAVWADQPEPFQCQAPARALGWRDFLRP